MKAKVWDPMNQDEEHARDHEVDGIDPSSGFEDFEDAAIGLAEKYAEEDTDGEIDQIYANGGHEITVLFDNGMRFAVTVQVDYEPSYYGRIKK